MRRWDRRVGLACACAGILLLLATLGFVIAEGRFSSRSASLLFAGLALAIIYLVVDPSFVLDVARDRRSRGAALSALASAGVIGLLIMANAIVSRGTQAYDLSRSGAHTLTPVSAQAAQQLTSDLVVTGFFLPNEQASRRAAQDLLAEYERQSPHVRVRFVDPDQYPQEASSLGVTVSGSVVLQYASHAPVVLNLHQEVEPDITGAIIRLESARIPILCWAAGDGERDPADTSDVQGYTAAAALLKSSNYKIQQVTLVQEGVPPTCDVLVLLGLSRPLADVSVTAVQSYLAGGGKLLVGMDPWMNANALASANVLLKPYGASYSGSLVVEGDPLHRDTQDATIPVVYTFATSPITNGLQNQDVFLPGSTPVTTSPAGTVVATSLAATTDQSYAIAQQRSDFSQRSGDAKGPFTLVESLEQRQAGGRTTRIVVAGTSALAENRTMPPSANNTYNPDLFLAALDWLSQQDGIIAVPARPPAAGPLTLGDRDARIYGLTALVLLPLLALIIGFLPRLRRRTRR